MHYFIRIDKEIALASCETNEGVEGIARAGYIECDGVTFSAAWAARDRKRKAELAVVDVQKMTWRDRQKLGI